MWLGEEMGDIFFLFQAVSLCNGWLQKLTEISLFYSIISEVK